MIFLKSIYSEPEGLFEKVIFKDGINIIYAGYKDERKEKGSLNSVGKSTLVKLINFCLLSSYDKNNDLYKAKKLTDKYTIVLEIEINSIIHLIKRSTKEPSKVLFGKIENLKEIEEFSINTIKQHLASLFFGGNNYEGEFSNKWFRKLIPFFLRDEFKGFGKTIDYIGGRPDLEMVPLNLFLLDIDNTLALKNLNLRTELKEKKKTQKDVTGIVKEKYGLKVEHINSKLDELKEDIIELESNLNNFTLDFSYKELEKEADNITEMIKDSIKHNQFDKNKLNKLMHNLDINIDVSIDKVKRMYEQLNYDLGLKVEKTLEEVIDFKHGLIQSRKKFLREELENIKKRIKARNKKIDYYSKKRVAILKLLEEKGAIKDLTNVVAVINEKNKELNDLNGKVSIYNDLQEDILLIQSQEAKLNLEINKFLKEHQTEITGVRKVFKQVYKELYGDTKGIFDVNFTSDLKDSKFEIKAQAPDSSGWGKGRASILIYDLTILLNAIIHNRQFPRFLIHDGIYNGVHRGQFVSTINFLSFVSSGFRFQYIFTANESDIWINNEDEDLMIDLEKKKITYYNDINKIFDTDFN